MQDSNSDNFPQFSQSSPHFPEASLTGLEAARFLSISPRTLEQWRRKRRGPAYYKVGRLVRYLLADLIQFQEANRIEPREE